ncbi:MAG: TetR/AcrR family transcriptional regulator [Clostridia bacterium]|nr:TetR/AcrR family transcriptional regulator [Clostridia bacterium]
MRTAKYLEEQNRIAKIAFNLFREKGYENTSFAAIAKEAGIAKNLLQYYFPKKEDFITLFIDTTLPFIFDSLRATLDGITSPVELLKDVYFLAYFEFWYLTKHEYIGHLTSDVLASRATSAIVAQEISNWFIENVKIIGNKGPALTDQIAYAIGGGLEYAYIKNQKGEEIDVDMIVSQSIVLLGQALGIPQKLLKFKVKVDPERLERYAESVDRQIFG